MQSGDGLLVRLRITAGRLSAQTATAIAQAASRYGSGEIDLSRRANLQLRGVQPETIEPLQQRLAALGLLDDNPAAEAVRNGACVAVCRNQRRAAGKSAGTCAGVPPRIARPARQIRLCH